MLKKRIKGMCFLFAVVLILCFNETSVYAINIGTLPGGSGNDIPVDTPSYTETEPAETATVIETVTDIPTEVITEAPELPDQLIVVPEAPIESEVPEQPIDSIVEESQPIDTLTFTEDTEQTETEIEDTTETDQSSSQEEISRETEIFLESSPEETWPMGFSGAGDGQFTQEDTTAQNEEKIMQKEGAGTIAKIFAGIVMVLIISGTVAYGYFSAAAKEEIRRRERRARAWSEYGDDDNE